MTWRENVSSLKYMFYCCVKSPERNIVCSDKNLARVNAGKNKCRPMVMYSIQSAAQGLWPCLL